MKVRLGEVPHGFDAESIVGTEVGIGDDTRVEGTRGGGGTVTRAWIEGEPVSEHEALPGQLYAEIEVPDDLARVLFQDVSDSVSIAGHRPTDPIDVRKPGARISSLTEFERLYGTTEDMLRRTGYDKLFGIPERGTIGHEKVCTCGFERDPSCPRHAKFAEGMPVYTVGSKHTIKRVGGFRTRYRVQLARGLWYFLWDARAWLSAGLDSA